jgi:hypothetical protein
VDYVKRKCNDTAVKKTNSVKKDKKGEARDEQEQAWIKLPQMGGEGRIGCQQKKTSGDQGRIQ